MTKNLRQQHGPVGWAIATVYFEGDLAFEPHDCYVVVHLTNELNGISPACLSCM